MRPSEGARGVVGKRISSIYGPGERSGAWIKHRTNMEQEFVIGGYIPVRSVSLERLHPARFARPEVMNQIAVVNAGGNAPVERVMVLPEGEFDTLVGRPGYHQRDNGDLERREGSLVYLIVRQQSNRALPTGE